MTTGRSAAIRRRRRGGGGGGAGRIRLRTDTPMSELALGILPAIQPANDLAAVVPLCQ
jgi:hypothetical protein